MSHQQSSLVFDNLDLDLVVKVFTHTALSPFFAFFVPVIYRAQGAPWDSYIMVTSISYFAAVASFWLLKFASRLWRNGGSLLFSPERLDWGEQIIVVTGGASGIGALLANTLAVRNVTVVVLDVNPIVTENYNIVYYKCDVSKWTEVEAVSKQIVEDLGHPTVVINNAGVVQGKLLLDLTEEDIKQTMDTNVLAHFWTLKAFLPDMIRHKEGHIITVSSVLGLVGSAQMTDYCASKAALVSLHESLRYELDKRYNAPGIRTTLVLPAHTHTPLFQHAPELQSASPLPSWLFRFFAPSLAPHSIVKAVIAALDEQESRTIMMPFFVNFVPYVTLLPSWGRDFFQWLSGADYAMKGFVKATGRREDEGEVTLANGKKEE